MSTVPTAVPSGHLPELVTQALGFLGSLVIGQVTRWTGQDSHLPVSPQALSTAPTHTALCSILLVVVGSVSHIRLGFEPLLWKRALISLWWSQPCKVQDQPPGPGHTLPGTFTISLHSRTPVILLVATRGQPSSQTLSPVSALEPSGLPLWEIQKSGTLLDLGDGSGEQDMLPGTSTQPLLGPPESGKSFLKFAFWPERCGGGPWGCGCWPGSVNS